MVLSCQHVGMLQKEQNEDSLVVNEYYLVIMLVKMVGIGTTTMTITTQECACLFVCLSVCYILYYTYIDDTYNAFMYV